MRSDLFQRVAVVEIRLRHARRVFWSCHDGLNCWSAKQALCPLDLAELHVALWHMLLDELLAAEVGLSAEILQHRGSADTNLW